MRAQIYALAFLALVISCYSAEVCPETDGDYAVHVANPSDCSTFFQCSNGEYILQSCPEGLEFNAELEVCDWPDAAGCVATLSLD